MTEVKKYPVKDYYFKHPITCDLIIIAMFWIGSFFINPLLAKIGIQGIKLFDKATSLTYLAYVTSANVTFAGFIIAALTILITVKSSLKARGFSDSENAMEYIFSTNNYYHIVKIFIDSIIELFIFFIVLYGTWLLSGNLTDKCLYKVLLFSTFGIITSVFRVLYILFTVLNLENLKRK